MVCNYSKIKTVLMIFLGLLMLSAGYFLTTVPGIAVKIVGWIGLCFFGLCFLIIVRSLFKKGPAFIVNEKGIEDFQSKWGLVPWADIVYVTIGVINRQRFLCVEVEDPNSYLSRIPVWQRFLINANKSLGFPAITISFNTLTPGLNEVWDYIKLNHPDKVKS